MIWASFKILYCIEMEVIVGHFTKEDPVLPCRKSSHLIISCPSEAQTSINIHGQIIQTEGPRAKIGSFIISLDTKKTKQKTKQPLVLND